MPKSHFMHPSVTSTQASYPKIYQIIQMWGTGLAKTPRLTRTWVRKSSRYTTWKKNWLIEYQTSIPGTSNRFGMWMPHSWTASGTNSNRWNNQQYNRLYNGQDQRLRSDEAPTNKHSTTTAQLLTFFIRKSVLRGIL